MPELIFRDDPYARDCGARVTAAEGGALRFDRTVFYPAGGGQPGDSGVLRFAGGEIRIVEAVKGDGPDEVLHRFEGDAALPAVGDEVTLALDWERRHRHMRMHTALHLLCSSVPGAVTGGQIAADKSRLDFDIPGAAVDKAALTERLNALIAEDHAVTSLWISDEELAARDDLVRTMSVKPPTGSGRVRLMRIGPEAAPVDLQACGGTHVAATGEIGPVAVTKIENKGKQNRRIVIQLAE